MSGELRGKIVNKLQRTRMFETVKCSGIHCGPGVNCYHQGRIDEAIDFYQEILQRSTARFHIVYSWLGIAYFHKKMLDEAVQTYQALLDIKPVFSMDDYHLETCSFCSELTAEIINLFTQMLKEKASHAFSHYFLGVAYYYKGDLDKSTDQLMKATEIDGKNRLYADNLAELQKIKERFYQ